MEFSKFGDIIDAIIMKNNETGQSRGFGFVTYRDAKAAQMAANTINKLDGKTVSYNNNKSNNYTKTNSG